MVRDGAAAPGAPSGPSAAPPGADGRTTTSTLRAGAGAVLSSGAARRLVGVRLLGSAADGGLQAALASLFFLSPDRAATAGGVALASAVLVAPFTLVGPWAAPLLDRFSRRRVLVVGSAVRAVLALGTAGAALTGSDVAVALGVLAYLSVNRLLLAALSAALPRLVADRDLVAANAVVPTVGSAAALAGGAVALAAGAAGAATPAVLAVVALACLLAGATARGFAPHRLGPDVAGAGTTTGTATGAGWSSGAGGPGSNAAAPGSGAPADRPGDTGVGAALAHLRSRPVPARALAVLMAQRMAYGVVLVVCLLAARNLLTTTAGGASALLGAALAATGAGAALAASLAPGAVRSVGARTWTDVCCLLGAAVALALLAAPHQVTLVAGAAVLGLSSQGIKVVTDAAVQAGVDDDFRGRVFVVYDMGFNLVLIAATALAALVLPDTGYSVPVLLVAAAWWVALAAAHRCVRGPGRRYGGARAPR